MKTILFFLIASMLLVIKSASAQNLIPVAYAVSNDSIHHTEVSVCNLVEGDSVPFFDNSVIDSGVIILYRYWKFPGAKEKQIYYSGYRPVVYAKWTQSGDYPVTFGVHASIPSLGLKDIDMEDNISVHVGQSHVALEKHEVNLIHFLGHLHDGTPAWFDSALAFAHNSEYSLFTWHRPNGTMDSELGTTSVFYAAEQGVYTVECISKNGGCSSWDTVMVFPDPDSPFAAVSETRSSKKVSLYPNPATSNKTITVNGDVSSIHIYDVTGREIASSDNSSIVLSHDGMCIVSVTYSDGTFAQTKLLVQQ